MDYCCATIKAKSVLIKGDNCFYGEKVRGSLNNRGFGIRFRKNLCGNGSRNVKPGVAFSVLTRDINKELAVS